jgi:hypothetical protein
MYPEPIQATIACKIHIEQLIHHVGKLSAVFLENNNVTYALNLKFLAF